MSNLNGKQFFRTHSTDYGHTRLTGTKYELVGDHPDFAVGDAQAVFGIARVHHQANVEKIVHPGDPDPKYPSTLDQDAYHDLHNPMPDEHGNVQERLFGYARQPDASVVEGMYFSKESRARVPTLLGLIAQDAAKEFGLKHPVVPSSNLSRHSGRLASRLADKGLAPDPNYRHDNGIDFRDGPVDPAFLPGATTWEVPEDEVKSARQFARDEIVGRKRRDRFEQGRLFE